MADGDIRVLITTALMTAQERYKNLHFRRLKEKERTTYAKRREYFREWDRKNRPPGSRREEQLQTDHGLSLIDYELIFNSQCGVCAICQRPETKLRKSGGKGERRVMPLSVDHDHLTGRIRGLLCDACNNGIARFGDDPERLIRAARYLGGGG